MIGSETLIAAGGLGAAYALAALGFVLIINAVGAVNFAQGDFVMAGGYVAVVAASWLSQNTDVAVIAPGLVILPLVLLAMAVIGLGFSALAYLPLRRRPPMASSISDS